MSPAKRTGKAAKTVVAANAIETPAVAPLLFVAAVGVRWSDLDAFNHVNNAVYLTYLEESRLQWLGQVPGPWFDEVSVPVLAASAVNYRQSIEWPAQLRVELRCERLGSSSITLSHRIIDAADHAKLYSDGHVVLVWMNPATGKSAPLPPAIRESAEPAGLPGKG